MATNVARGKAKVGYVIDESTVVAIKVVAARRSIRASKLVEEILRAALDSQAVKDSDRDPASTN